MLEGRICTQLERGHQVQPAKHEGQANTIRLPFFIIYRHYLHHRTTNKGSLKHRGNAEKGLKSIENTMYFRHFKKVPPMKYSKKCYKPLWYMAFTEICLFAILAIKKA